MPPYYYSSPSIYYIPAIIALFFALWAQFRVKSTFNKQSKIKSRNGLTGARAARMILDSNGLYHIKVEHISGNLNDHYDPRTNVIRLSDAVFDNTSIASIGVAAHEAGHAIQHAKGYVPIKIRSAIIPITNFGSYGGILLFMVGLIMQIGYLQTIGLILFSFVFLFQLVTLPVEFNASSRAIAILRSSGMLGSDELGGARKVLTAAALTYVAAMVQALAQLIYYISLANNRRRD